MHVAVLGAGPAGLAAALWCAELGLGVRVFERASVAGGQLLRIPGPITNVPGLSHTDGAALRDTLLAQLADRGVVPECGVPWTLAPSGPLRLRGGEAEIAPEAVVLATGVRRRTLGIPGEASLAGIHNNIGPDPARWAGRNILIVGGGDDALEHVELLAPVAAQVTLVHRSAHFRARPHFRAAVFDETGRPHRDNVRCFAPAQVSELRGDAKLAGVTLQSAGGEERIEVEALFRCIGPAPDTGSLGVALLPSGAVDVDRLQRTTREGVFAVGDCACVESPTLPTAFGQGSTAAKEALAWSRGQSPWREPPPREEAPTPPDRLTIANLSLPAQIGVYGWEHGRVQTLRFDLSVEIDAAASARSDALRDTLDYASVSDAIEAELRQGHVRLVETVADRVAAMLLQRFPLRAVRLRVTKPEVPRAGAQAVVEVHRRRG